MKRQIDMILETLKTAGKPLCCIEISDLTGIRLQSVQERISTSRQRAKKKGLPSGIRIAHYAKRKEGVGYGSAYFALGDLPDAPKPSKKGQLVHIIQSPDDWRAKEAKKHDAAMRKLRPVLVQVRGNPWGSIAVQWGAM